MAQKLSNLANKSKVKFGSLYGSPIIWLVADKNHAGYPSNSVTLVTNQIIKMLCFDATEPSNGNSDRPTTATTATSTRTCASGSTAPRLPASGTPRSTPQTRRRTPPTSGTATTHTAASPVF